MTRSALISVSMLCLLIAGCEHFRLSEPKVDVGIMRDGDSYKISFKGCSRAETSHDVEVPLIVLLETTGTPRPATLEDEERHAYCQIRKQTPSVRNIKGSWYYGVAPPGYVVTGCAPLEPGKAYELHVGRGYRQFRLTSTGDVINGAGSCGH